MNNLEPLVLPLLLGLLVVAYFSLEAFLKNDGLKPDKTETIKVPVKRFPWEQ